MHNSMSLSLILIQRWARAFREDQFHAAVETNNGIEAQNKALKYAYLPRKAVCLSHIVNIIIEQFLPEQHRKYLFLNFQMNPMYRAYSTHVPSYLHGRPRNVIIHCLEREQRARKTLSPEDIISVDSERGIFSVRGKSGYTHTVDFGTETEKPSCTCQDWAKNNLPCKHFFLVFTNICGWGWSSLPQSYLNSPYLCCDGVSLIKTATSSPSECQQESLVPEELQDELPLKVYM